MIKTILFDFGNVVAFFDHDRALRRLLAHTDRTAEQLWQLVYQDGLAYRYECGEVTTEQLAWGERRCSGTSLAGNGRY